MKALTVLQASERLGVSEQTIRNLMDSGRLPHIRIPSPTPSARCIRRIDADVLEAFIKENTVAA